MKCSRCKISVMVKSLERVNAKGEEGIWWCRDCIREEEPELFMNILEDKSDVENDLEAICYPKKKKL